MLAKQLGSLGHPGFWGSATRAVHWDGPALLPGTTGLFSAMRGVVLACMDALYARVNKKSGWCMQEGSFHVSLVIGDGAAVGTLGWLLAQGLTLPAGAIGSCFFGAV